MINIAQRANGNRDARASRARQRRDNRGLADQTILAYGRRRSGEEGIPNREMLIRKTGLPVAPRQATETEERNFCVRRV